MESALKLDERNAKLVEDFIKELPIMSAKRLDKHRSVLRNVQRLWLGKGFEEADRADLKRVFQGIRESDYEPWTQDDYFKITKKFFRWLQNDEFVKGFRFPSPEETVGPEDILTDEELFRVYQVCHSLRDKALSNTAYESAMRPHELLRLRKNDVLFDESGAIVYVRPASSESNAKTGSRPVRVINAAPLLANWIENHPLKPADSPLWVDMSTNTTFEALKWSGYSKIVKRWTAEARIEKHITAYLFRHTRLTHLAKFMTEAQLCVFAGWKIGSDMPRMYVHLSGRDVDDTLLKAYGLKKGEEIQERVPKKCVRCGALSEAEAETCSKCGMALTLQAALKRDEEIEKLAEGQKRINEIIDKLRERGLI